MTEWRIEASTEARTDRPWWPALRTGLLGRCPKCCKGKLFYRYLKVADHCPHCQETLSHHRADDAPAYFTILIVGHIVVPMVAFVETRYQPAYWIHALLWCTLITALSLWLLPIVKGGLVNFQWAVRMHGFGETGEEENEALFDGAPSGEPEKVAPETKDEGL